MAIARSAQTVCLIKICKVGEPEPVDYRLARSVGAGRTLLKSEGFEPCKYGRSYCRLQKITPNGVLWAEFHPEQLSIH